MYLARSPQLSAFKMDSGSKEIHSRRPHVQVAVTSMQGIIYRRNKNRKAATVSLSDLGIVGGGRREHFRQPFWSKHPRERHLPTRGPLSHFSVQDAGERESGSAFAHLCPLSTNPSHGSSPIRVRNHRATLCRCTAVPELSESWPPQRTPLCLVSHVLVRDLAEKGEAYGRGTLHVEQRRINAMRNRRGFSKLHIISLQHFFVKKSTSTSSWLASDETASMYRPSEQPTLPWLARAPSSRRCEWSETVISPVRESGCSGNLGLPQGAVHWRFQPGPKPSLSQHRHPIQSKEHHLPTPTYLPAPSLP